MGEEGSWERGREESRRRLARARSSSREELVHKGGRSGEGSVQEGVRSKVRRERTSSSCRVESEQGGVSGRVARTRSSSREDLEQEDGWSRGSRTRSSSREDLEQEGYSSSEGSRAMLLIQKVVKNEVKRKMTDLDID